MTEPCRKTSEIAFDEIVLDPESGDWAELRAHAATCPVCSAELADWTRIGAGLREMREETRIRHPREEARIGHLREEDLLRFHSQPESLADGEKAEIVAHLAGCRACSEELFTVDTFDFSRADAASAPVSPPRRTARRRIAPWKTVSRVALHPAFAYAIALVAGVAAIRQTYFQPESDSPRERRSAQFAARREAPADTGAPARNAYQPSQEKLAAAAGERDADLGRDRAVSAVESPPESDDVRAFAPAGKAGSHAAALLDEQKRTTSDSAEAKAGRGILDDIAAQHPSRWSDRYRSFEVAVKEAGQTIGDYNLDLYERRDSSSRYRSLIVFRQPPEWNGFAVLRDDQREMPEKLWTVMPDIRRIQARGARDLDFRFSGLDLTYRDLDLLDGLPLRPEAHASSILRASEVLDGTTCDVIEITLQDESTPYGKIVVGVGTQDGVLRQAEFFLRGESGTEATKGPARRLRQLDIRWFDEIPVPHEIEVQNLAEGSTTRLKVVEARVNQGLSESMFEPRNLVQQAVR